MKKAHARIAICMVLHERGPALIIMQRPWRLHMHMHEIVIIEPSLADDEAQTQNQTLPRAIDLQRKLVHVIAVA
jgi:hypothetical protein